MVVAALGRAARLVLLRESEMAKIVPPFVRSPYNYDTAAASDESALICRDVSLTQQSEMEAADINVIMRRFGVTGQLPQGVRMPTYGDFTGISDFRSAVEAMDAAQASFMEMPADVRDRFKNDPQQFLAFCSDPANLGEAAKLGLVSADAYKRLQDAEAKAEADRQAEIDRRVAAAVAAREAARVASSTPPVAGDGGEAQ